MKFQKILFVFHIRSVDILWRRRSRVSKDKHLEGCIKTLRGSSLVGGGGGWAEGGKHGGLWGRGSGVKAQKGFH